MPASMSDRDRITMSEADAGQPEAIEVLASGVWVARADLTFTFTRGSGPGGQAVNKLSTAAQLRVPLDRIHGLDERAAARLRHLAGRRLTDGGELLVRSRTHRSQLDNRRACLERLGRLVAAASAVPRVRRKTRPTKAMIERRLAEKKRQADKKRQRRRDADA